MKAMESDTEIVIEQNFGELTPFQTSVIEKMYETSRKALQELEDYPFFSDVMIITMTITKLCGLYECIKINDDKLSGRDKKTIVLAVGRLLLLDILSSERYEEVVLIYDSSAEGVLDMIIEFAKYNKIIKKVTAPCFMCSAVSCS